MISVEEVFEIAAGLPVHTKTARVPVKYAVNKALAQNVFMRVDAPSFDTAAMDGFAVLSADTVKASSSHPVRLKCASDVQAGKAVKFRVQSGNCVPISTGAMLPHGCDAVVEKEIVFKENHEVVFSESAKKWRNIRKRGESFKKGEMLFVKETTITPFHLGLLCQSGIARAKIHVPPSVALIVTGDELVSVDKKLAPAKVYDVSPGIVEILKYAGVENVSVLHAKDSIKSVREVMRKALCSDIVITLGGVSAGDHDLIRVILPQFGVKQILFKVAQKPGKPLYIGKKGNVIVFGLPGNPLANHVCLWVYVRPFLQRWCKKDASPAWKTAKLSLSYKRYGDRAHFMTGILNDGHVEIVSRQPSYTLLPLSHANCIAYFSTEKQSFKRGSSVPVLPLS